MTLELGAVEFRPHDVPGDYLEIKLKKIKKNSLYCLIRNPLLFRFPVVVNSSLDETFPVQKIGGVFFFFFPPDGTLNDADGKCDQAPMTLTGLEPSSSSGLFS